MGNLYPTLHLPQLHPEHVPKGILLSPEHFTGSATFSISEIVSVPFFYNDHGSLDVNRGPYEHSREWLAAQLQMALHDVDRMPVDKVHDEASDPEFRNNSPAAIRTRVSRLQALLPKIFPSTDHESFILHHQDLSSNNIMINASHALSGIIDWECVRTAPLWLACQSPRFLCGPAHDLPPPIEEVFEDESCREKYYDDLKEYEKTRLREFFLEEMERVCPEWTKGFRESNLKANFDCAVSFVTAVDTDRDIDEWIEAAEKGEEACGLRMEVGQC